MKTITGKFLVGLVLSVSTASSSFAASAGQCSGLFFAQKPAVVQFVQVDAYKQWLVWEQEANVEKFRKSRESVPVPAALVPRDQISIQASHDVPRDFYRYIVRRENVLWLKHPYNTTNLAFADAPNIESLSAYLTASRSLVLSDNRFRGISIKLPTDRPHGPNGEHQPAKANTADDIAVALLHSNHLKNVDRAIGRDDNLVLLHEVLTVADKATNNGLVVRDVRKLDDGHYYVPALSIPWIGRQIAEINGEDFNTFWQRNYASLLGESKAKLLLRYGIQMETPNAQNMLIQFDRNMKPTGRLVFRDVSDAFFVDAAARGLGFSAEVARDIAVDYTPKTFLRPFWSNSSWRFDEAGALSVDRTALSSWGDAHNRAYTETLRRELGLASIPDGFTGDNATTVYNALNSAEGQAALTAYAERMRGSLPRAAGQ